MNGNPAADGAIGPPVLGRWLVLNPPGHAPYAFDLVGIDPLTGRYASGSAWRLLAGMMRVEDVFGWSRPVHAPLAGKVVTAHDGERDRRRLVPLIDVPAGFIVRPFVHRGRVAPMAGNHVVLDTPEGYVLLAHLRHGSITVRAGQHVETGQLVGRVGSSGNSVGPHLHLQVMDGHDPLTARVVPFRLTQYSAWNGSEWDDQFGRPLPHQPTKVHFHSPRDR